MNTDFPEDNFQPRKHLASIYKYKVQQGQKIAKNKSILFCSICRDVGDVLERNILRLNRIGSMFNSYRMFFYENDSSDNTLEILSKYRSNTLDYISEQRQDKDYKKLLDSGEDRWHYNRCKILAECRNIYIDYSKDKSFDYLCVIDADLRGGWSYDGIAHSIFTLENNHDNACVSSYGILSDYNNELSLEEVDKENYLMYDSFAFRPLNSQPIHMFRLQSYNYIKFDRGDEPVRVDSNFGGMAIYKYGAIEHARYSAKMWKDGCVDPDHVMFNKQVNGNIILDPSMICSYSNHRYCYD